MTLEQRSQRMEEACQACRLGFSYQLREFLRMDKYLALTISDIGLGAG